MLSVEDWAEIRRLHRAERVPIKVFARTLGVSKNTVRNALRADGPRLVHHAEVIALRATPTDSRAENSAASPRPPPKETSSRGGQFSLAARGSVFVRR